MVVDPQRDIDIYLEFLEENSLELQYVLETHLHADFISGHLELAEKTGAQIVISEKARAEFPHIAVDEGSKFAVGGAEISVLATPGHTPESVCYLAKEGSAPMVLFTGDTLFAGDVGRPDLMDKTIPAEQLAELLYFSLRDKIMKLPDDTIVYPAHGAGSSCGRDLQDVESTTIGEQKATNYALQPMDVQKFTKLVIEGQPPAPAYFLLSAAINRKGAPKLDNVLENYQRLGLDEFLTQGSREGSIILDVRDEDDFSKSHIPNSFHIGLDGRYAEWVGGLIPPDEKIYIVAPPGQENEAAVRCARVGFDNVIGFLDGGYQTYLESGKETSSFERVDTITPDDLRTYTVIDIRRFSERSLNRIDGTIHIPLHELAESLDEIPRDKGVLIHCAGGYRSVIGTSILLRNGFTDVRDLKGGLDPLIEARHPIVNSQPLTQSTGSEVTV